MKNRLLTFTLLIALLCLHNNVFGFGEDFPNLDDFTSPQRFQREAKKPIEDALERSETSNCCSDPLNSTPDKMDILREITRKALQELNSKHNE